MNYVGNHWTSDLIIQSDVDLDIKSEITFIENNYISSNRDHKINVISNELIESMVKSRVGSQNYEEFINYRGDDILDATGLIKGLAIDLISQKLKSLGSRYHTISFGGDILVYNNPTRVKVSDKFYINLSNGCVFTSNNKLREGHIITSAESAGVEYDSVTVIGRDPIKCDMIATSSYAKSIDSSDPYTIKFLGDYPIFKGDRIYCASPFFNEEEVRIRDEMISKFPEEIIFRPDKTEASNSYSRSPGEELSKKIYSENMQGIARCNIILFPKRTEDLGTLYEVGRGLLEGKVIISYDHLTGIYEIVNSEEAIRSLKESIKGFESKSISINLNSPGNAILLGYLSDYKSSKMRVYYRIPEGKNDNIMLVNNFDRIDKNNMIVERNYAEVS